MPITVDDLFTGAGRMTECVSLGKLSATFRVITFDEMLHVQEAAARDEVKTASRFMAHWLAAALVSAGGHEYADPYASGTWDDKAHGENFKRVLSMAEVVGVQLGGQLGLFADRARRLLWHVPTIAEVVNGKTLVRPAAEEEHIEEVVGRCTALAEDELFATGRVKQHVAILPGKLEVVFQSLSVEERDLVEMAGLGLYAMGQGVATRLGLALVSMNGVLFEPHVTEERPDREKLDKKIREIRRLPMPVIAELDGQELRFTERVAKAFAWDRLKNG